MSYRVEHPKGRVLVTGTSIPIEEMVALQKVWSGRGLDTLATGVASSLGALLAICREEDLQAWEEECRVIAKQESGGNRELEWLLSPDTGTSSMSIFWVLASKDLDRDEVKRKLRNHFDVPHDPDDFGRCHRLLQLFPEWYERLDSVARVLPRWAGYVAEWSRMTELYLEELPTGRWPQLYDFMQKIAIATKGKFDEKKPRS